MTFLSPNKHKKRIMRAIVVLALVVLCCLTNINCKNEAGSTTPPTTPSTSAQVKNSMNKGPSIFFAPHANTNTNIQSGGSAREFSSTESSVTFPTSVQIGSSGSISSYRGSTVLFSYLTIARAPQIPPRTFGTYFTPPVATVTSSSGSSSTAFVSPPSLSSSTVPPPSPSPSSTISPPSSSTVPPPPSTSSSSSSSPSSPPTPPSQKQHLAAPGGTFSNPTSFSSPSVK